MASDCCAYPAYLTAVESVGPVYVELQFCESCGNIHRLETYRTRPSDDTRNAYLGAWTPADDTDDASSPAYDRGIIAGWEMALSRFTERGVPEDTEE